MWAAFLMDMIIEKRKPSRNREGKRLSLVQRAGHAGLLAIGGVLGDDALRGGLVNSGRSSNQRLGGHVVVELLHRGLGGGLNHLIAQSLALGNADALDSGLNVRHCSFPPNSLEIINRNQYIKDTWRMQSAHKK